MNSNCLTDLNTAMSMYQTHYGSTDKLWAYFSSVTLALIAYTISNEKVTRSYQETCAAVSSYFIFCLGNFFALKRSQEQLVSLASIVREQASLAKKQCNAQNLDLSQFTPFTSIEIFFFYWLAFAAIVGASFALTKFRIEDKSKPQKQ